MCISGLCVKIWLCFDSEYFSLHHWSRGGSVKSAAVQFALTSTHLFFIPHVILLLPSASRPVGTRDPSGRNKGVDENYNNVSSPSRAGLAGKLQQLLTPTKHRVSVRRAASVDDRHTRGGGGGIGRRVSEQRQSRKSQVAETLLKAKDKLVSATSEVWLLFWSVTRKCFTTLI